MAIEKAAICLQVAANETPAALTTEIPLWTKFQKRNKELRVGEVVTELPKKEDYKMKYKFEANKLITPLIMPTSRRKLFIFKAKAEVFTVHLQDENSKPLYACVMQAAELSHLYDHLQKYLTDKPNPSFLTGCSSSKSDSDYVKYECQTIGNTEKILIWTYGLSHSTHVFDYETGHAICTLLKPAAILLDAKADVVAPTTPVSQKETSVKYKFEPSKVRYVETVQSGGQLKIAFYDHGKVFHLFFWKDDVPVNTCILSEEGISHLYDHLVSNAVPNQPCVFNTNETDSSVAPGGAGFVVNTALHEKKTLIRTKGVNHSTRAFTYEESQAIVNALKDAAVPIASKPLLTQEEKEHLTKLGALFARLQESKMVPEDSGLKLVNQAHLNQLIKKVIS